MTLILITAFSLFSLSLAASAVLIGSSFLFNVKYSDDKVKISYVQ